MKKPLLGVIGSLPRPVGGVTAFLDRFVSRLFVPDIFLDYVYSNTKPIFCEDRVEYFVSKGFIGSAFVYFGKELERLLFKRSKIIWFVNFSTPGGLLRSAFLAKMPRATWVLMLHNGDLGHFGMVRVLPDCFFRWLYGRFDKILVISQKQQAYYLKYIRPEKMAAVKSYLPAPNYGHFSSVAVSRLLAMKDERESPLITLSGYALKEYGYELFFDAIIPLLDRNFLICLCCYGDRPDRVRQFIPAACSDRVLIFTNLSEHGFAEVLKATDIYVRSNLVDSFGVAVADAVSMGKIVIASDVCERVPGAILFQSGDVESLREKVRMALDGEMVPFGRQAFDKFEEENSSKLCAVFLGASN